MKVTVEGPVGPAGNKFNVTTVWATVNRCIFENIEEIWNAGSKKSCQPRSSDWVGHLRFLSFISSQVRLRIIWELECFWKLARIEISFIHFFQGGWARIWCSSLLSWYIISDNAWKHKFVNARNLRHMNICNCALCIYVYCRQYISQNSLRHVN